MVGEDELWMVEAAPFDGATQRSVQVVMVLVLFSCFVCEGERERERERKRERLIVQKCFGRLWTVVLGWPWWWIDLWCFYCSEMDYFIVVDILFYCIES